VEKEFFQLTSPEIMNESFRSTMDKNVTVFLKKTIHTILSKESLEAPNSLIKLKVFHDMIRHLFEHNIDEISKVNHMLIQNGISHQMEAIDASIMIFSESIKSLYAKYGETLQEIDLIHLTNEEARNVLQESKEMIFLTDIKRKPYISLFNTRKNLELETAYQESQLNSLEDITPQDRINSLFQSWKMSNDAQFFEKILNKYLTSCDPPTSNITKKFMEWSKEYFDIERKDLISGPSGPVVSNEPFINLKNPLTPKYSMQDLIETKNRIKKVLNVEIQEKRYQSF
jgi:hypothetical protein